MPVRLQDGHVPRQPLMVRANFPRLGFGITYTLLYKISPNAQINEQNWVTQQTL